VLEQNNIKSHVSEEDQDLVVVVDLVALEVAVVQVDLVVQEVQEEMLDQVDQQDLLEEEDMVDKVDLRDMVVIMVSRVIRVMLDLDLMVEDGIIRQEH
tara:strand:+ start:621 stop:914 length:294 start_codon:yes stop_codon:yes gene_type:complete